MNKIFTRKDKSGIELVTRRFAIDCRTPGTFNKEARSIDVIAATEEPVYIYEYPYGNVPEVLLMSGCKLPASRQVPLLDAHNRNSTADVMGSVRDLKTDNDILPGRAVFSSTAQADEAMIKAEEGHLTDLSVGYRVLKSQFVPEKTAQIIGGKTFNGPVLVRTSWQVKEISVCPIGADDRAKMRTENQNGGADMPEYLRKKLEALGLKAEATEEEAWRFLEKLDIRTAETAKTDDGKADTGLDAERAVKVERDRIIGIRTMAKELLLDDAVADGMIERGITIEQAQSEALRKVMANLQTPPSAAGSVVIVQEERDKFRAACEDSLLLRVGSRPDKPAPGFDELTGYSLRELARLALRRAGQRETGDPMGMVGRAFTTSDLPLILANVAHKQLLAGWNAAEETWPIWCSTGNLSDFKIADFPRASEFDDLDLIVENDEYKYGKIVEAREQAQLFTYGKLFAISRQAIVNDDLGVISTIPARQGRAAARKVGDMAYLVLTANANMADGYALFSSNHLNLMTAGAPAIGTVTLAVAAMKKQKDSNSKTLNIRPVFFLAPVELEGTCEQLFRSTLEGTQAKPNQINPYAGSYFTRVYEPRLSVASAFNWYLAAQKGQTVQVFFLNGQSEPYLEQREGWNVDGVEMKVRIDGCAKALDWRGLVKNPATS